MQDIGSPDTGWTAACMTVGGATLGPLVCFICILLGLDYLPAVTDVRMGWLILGSPIAMIAGFFLGTLGGYSLGKRLGRVERSPSAAAVTAPGRARRAAGRRAWANRRCRKRSLRESW
jgi:hypothetical protein